MNLLGLFSNMTIFSSFTSHATKNYGPNARHKLDLYTPKTGVTAQTSVILFLHGGGFQEGDKSTYSYVGQSFVKAGYIVAVANYRLWNRRNPTVNRFPIQYEDALLALTWLRANARVGGFARRVFVMGHSAGGILGAHLLTRDAPIAGAVLLAGAYNLDTVNRYDLLPQTAFAPGTADTRNATHHVSGGEPPSLLIEGTLDEINAHVGMTRVFADTLMAFSPSDVETYFPAGVNHVDVVKLLATGSSRVRPEILAWLARH